MDTERYLNAERYYHGIDIIALIIFIFKRSYLIAIAAVIGAAVSRYYVTHYVSPVYQATSKIYIVGSESTVSIADLQLGSTLARDYQEVFRMNDVHQKVADRTGVRYSPNALSDMVSVSIPSGSHVMYISVRSGDREEARMLADTYAEVAQDYISNTMELRRPQLLEKARVPSSPVSPNIRTMIKDGAVIGGFIPAFFLFLLFLFNDRIRSAGDITEKIRIPVFGTLPIQDSARSMEEADVSSVTPPAGMQKAEIREIPGTDYHYMESMNTICTALSFVGSGTKRLVVTSCDPDNGKTFTSFQMCKCLAERGKRVLLVDCDLRKSVMLSRYRIQLGGKGTGLSHYLSGQCNLSDALYSTNIEGVFLIPVGECVQTPLSLISSAEMKDMLNQLSDSFDMIIIDTPPIGSVVDAVEAAHYCDGILLIAENKKTNTRKMKEIVARIQQNQIPIAGCILNKVKSNRLIAKYYHNRYGYGKHNH